MMWTVCICPEHAHSNCMKTAEWIDLWFLHTLRPGPYLVFLHCTVMTGTGGIVHMRSIEPFCIYRAAFLNHGRLSAPIYEVKAYVKLLTSLPGGVRCLSVCLSVRSHNSTTAWPNFIYFVHVAHGRGSCLLWRRCDVLCTSGFVDDVIFHISGNTMRRA